MKQDAFGFRIGIRCFAIRAAAVYAIPDAAGCELQAFALAKRF